ncbi:MAG: CRISPR-associated helicase Cas3' [Pyrinomonadaceae bacterium]
MKSRMPGLEHLLAKSYKRSDFGDAPPSFSLLTRHSRDVVAACDALAASVGRIALACSDLPDEVFTDFQLSLRANGWAQDLGKANSHFVRMLQKAMERDTSYSPQLIRHETLSGLLLTREPLREWFSSLGRSNSPVPSEMLQLAALWGAMGHHRKFHEDSKSNPEAEILTAYVTHPDFSALLKEMGDALNLDKALLPDFKCDLTVTDEEREGCDIAAEDELARLRRDFKKCAKRLFADEQSRRMLALIKGFGIAADVAASAVAKRESVTLLTDKRTKDEREIEPSVRDYSLTAYIESSFINGKLLTSEMLWLLMMKWAWERSEHSSANHPASEFPPDVEPRRFQNEVATIDNVDEAAESKTTYLKLAQAGCGSGKSLAAYMWARAWSEKLVAPNRADPRPFRLFFLLPTTGTATEQFKDYALESGIDDVTLTHSRATIDLDAMTETAAQEEADDNETDAPKAARAALKAKQDKIAALELWRTPLVVGTADTVLGLMANSRRAVCSLPAIMSSAIVFDEIHAFDEQMFGHLLIFLKNFPRLPVLLMTASLPEVRRHAIQQVRNDLVLVPGPPEFEMLPRYLIHNTASDAEVWEAVVECVRKREKVLWVRNRVEWANKTYHECHRLYVEEHGAYVDVYHARFRYMDRAERHRRVIKNFKPDKIKSDSENEGSAAANQISCCPPKLDRRQSASRAAILVATQVAEMSLDLSADLLITDDAPVPSLIQRMGRLNRRSTPKNPLPPRWAYVRPIAANAEKPYEKRDYKQTAIWLSKLAEKGDELSQKDLSEAFAQCAVDEHGMPRNTEEIDIAEAEENAIFFSGLWQTKIGQTRGAGYTVNAIWEPDLKKWKRQQPGKKPTSDWLRKHEFSITYKDAVRRWKPVGGVLIAPEEEVKYDYDEKSGDGTGAEWR